MNNLYSTTLTDFSRLPSQNYISPSHNFDDINLDLNYNKSYNYSNYSINKNNVLIFVMEQVSYNDFINSSNLILDEHNFFIRTQNNSHHFTNYYTTNQDSLTGLWSMLYSTFIPFEAYINNWNYKFGHILDNKNLIDLFNKHNYTTTAALSQFEDSLILGAFNWDENIFLKKYPIKDFICLKELEYQSGCEDLAIIEEVKNSIKKNEQTFLFQEFIFGHSNNYINRMGMSRVEYYNKYLNLIYDFLEKENLIDNTTIVVVSDHGDKGFSDKNISDYKIPLVVIDSQLNYKKINSLYSHIDFKKILLSYLYKEKKLPSQRDEVFIIGQTASSEFAYINSSNSYFTSTKFIKDIYTYNSFNMREEDVKNSIDKIIYNQEIFKNISSSKDFYCIYCKKNKEKIINARNK